MSTVELPEAVAARFEAEANRRGVTVGELLTSLADHLPASDRPRKPGRPLGFVGLGSSTSGRRARGADDLLAEGFGRS